MNSAALCDGALAMVCLACVFQLGKLDTSAPVAGRARRYGAQLGFALAAVAAAMGGVRYGLFPQLKDWHDFLSAVSALIGFPLIGLSMLSFGRKTHWSASRWGVWLLALCAGFALFRHLGWAGEYGLLLQGTTLVAIVYSGALRWPVRLPVIHAVVGTILFVFAGLVVGAEGFWGPVRREDIFHILLAIAFCILAWQMVLLARTESQVSIPE